MKMRHTIIRWAAVPLFFAYVGIDLGLRAVARARQEWRLQREAKRAVAQHLDGLRAERERANRIADENEWGIN